MCQMSQADINNWGMGGIAAAALLRRQSCTFTGHRSKKLPWKSDEVAPDCIALKALLAERIAALAENGVVHFLTGGSDGIDLYATEAVLELREHNPAIKRLCILPCREQAGRWPVAPKKRYNAVLEQADAIVYVSQSYHENCMLERNRFMVQLSSVVLAVYNGEKRGGTAATVRYARRMGRDLLVIDPTTLTLTHEEAVYDDCGRRILLSQSGRRPM